MQEMPEMSNSTKMIQIIIMINACDERLYENVNIVRSVRSIDKWFRTENDMLWNKTPNSLIDEGKIDSVRLYVNSIYKDCMEDLYKKK